MTAREQREYLKRENLKYPTFLVMIPREDWPSAYVPKTPPIEVWRSRQFLVQVFQENGGIERLSVIRTEILPNGRWAENITWDELQEIKTEVGRGGKFAVEVFPAVNDLVNVANMRHLWVLPEPPLFAWLRDAHQRGKDETR